MAECRHAAEPRRALRRYRDADDVKYFMMSDFSLAVDSLPATYLSAQGEISD